MKTKASTVAGMVAAAAMSITAAEAKVTTSGPAASTLADLNAMGNVSEAVKKTIEQKTNFVSTNPDLKLRMSFDKTTNYTKDKVYEKGVIFVNSPRLQNIEKRNINKEKQSPKSNVQGLFERFKLT